jgi:DNA-binding SARP family transcriptional activator
MGPEEGDNNLHKALYTARRILEPDLPPRRASSYLRLRHDLLFLEAPGGLWIDVEAFLAAAREAHESRTPQAYREALRLYTGDLVLEEHDEDWAIAQQAWLSGLRMTLLVELAGVQEQSGDFSMAIETLQEAVASDPVHEEAHRLLMRLLVQTGRRHLALRHYQALRAALQRELDAEPAASLQALYQDILDDRADTGIRSHSVDESTREVLARMAEEWGKRAASYAAADAALELERGSGQWEPTYSETFAAELERFRAALEGVPPHLIPHLVALFEAAKPGFGG